MPDFCYNYFLNKLLDLNNFETCTYLSGIITSNNERVNNEILYLNNDINNTKIQDYENDISRKEKYIIYESKNYKKNKN